MGIKVKNNNDYPKEFYDFMQEVEDLLGPDINLDPDFEEVDIIRNLVGRMESLEVKYDMTLGCTDCCIETSECVFGEKHDIDGILGCIYIKLPKIKQFQLF